MDRSDSGEVTHDDFLGFKLPSEMKEQVKRQAEAEGISVSEKVRRELRKGAQAAERESATT